MKSVSDSRNSNSEVSKLNINNEQSQKLFRNFILFCLLYAVAHATVDAVLAFSAAELGPTLGSYGGFSLYIFYTLSALLLAKVVLKFVDSKNTVFCGLSGLLIYVTSFFLALLFRSHASSIFIAGAGLGGIGAGLLWTAQGSYYSSNAILYARALGSDSKETMTNFASIFAGLYLGLESTFKFLATFIYLLAHGGTSWKIIVFGLYTATAFVAVCCFYLFVMPLQRVSFNNNEYEQEESIENPMSSNTTKKDSNTAHSETSQHVIAQVDNRNNSNPTYTVLFNTSQHSDGSIMDDEDNLHECQEPQESDSTTLSSDLSAVMRALLNDRLLQLIVPYQLCFGFSAGFVEFYVNGVIVKNSLGDGYIGLLSAVTTLTAVFLAAPFAYVSNRFISGKYWVMVIGGVCFLLAGFPLLVASDQQLGHWSFLVFYFALHGASRSAWEGINKAIVSEYFPDPRYREAAFAAVYFTSGLSGAMGFFSYQYMSRTALALLNTIVPIIATICFHWSYLCHLDDKVQGIVRTEHTR